MLVTDTLNKSKSDSTKKSEVPLGLSNSEAKKYLLQFGKNSIEQESKKNAFLIFLAQFNNPIVYLLLFAAGMSFFFKEWLDGIAILVVLLINSCIGFYMEFQADRSMEALKKLSTISAKVFRDGELIEINCEEIVPGDIIYLEAGDLVTADSRILKSSQLQVDESSLTGESIPVEKQAEKTDENSPIAERTDLLYKGTCVAKGNAHALVTATGMRTELGKIARLVQSADQSATPLEKKLEEFSKMLIKITVAIVVIIFIVGLLNGQKLFEMLETSIALAVAAIPEGLPIVATLALAQGMLKMARQNVIVKKLSVVETLGGTNVICTDKTGTLTQNKIEVSEVKSHDSEIMMRIAVLCNTATVSKEGKETGDPLETALLKYAMKQAISADEFRKKYPIEKEEPFSSETKVMTMLCKTDNGFTAYCKGAVEEILKRCIHSLEAGGVITMNEPIRTEWLTKAEQMASSGLRVIGGAFKNTNKYDNEISQGLVFTGLFGMIDPPRDDVFEAIKECKAAGINVVMITGDHPATAKNIAQQLGIISSQNAGGVIGKEMNEYDKLSEDEKTHWINSHVFARVNPKQKLDLVHIFQEKKFIVAMTGDGVNDAPALKKADIGIAMGMNGTQVAQEVADMILKDNSFTSIVRAIKQGRIIFENIRKFVIFLLSCNISELLVIATASSLNLHFQLFPLQILFINIITDVLPALALGITEGSDSIMKLPPRNIEEPIIDKKRWWTIIFYSIIIAVSSIGAVFISHLTVHNTELWNPELCNNILFFSLIFSQLFHVFNMGSSTSFFNSEAFRNKYVWGAIILSLTILFGTYAIEPIRNVLSVYEMSVYDLLISFGASIVSLIIIQIARKLKIVVQ
ncbi:MAG: cation-translocating P-type ATPase [Bacteroidetes bacterium]|nr:MAG: cation-translocating P-type ATPase [Bacteroidota bacterium]